MAISPLGAVGPAAVSGAGSVPKPTRTFNTALTGQLAPQRLENARLEVRPPTTEARAAVDRVAPCRTEAPARTESMKVAGKLVDHVQAAQIRMDSILALAESGKAFSPAELLSLQANIYRASQELDLAGKVVEKATGGVKQVLQTQV